MSQSGNLIETARGVALAVGPDPKRTEFPYAYSITLAGDLMPGKWTLKEAPKKFGWQIQKGFGLSGAFVAFMGDELIVPKFEIELWASDDCRRFKLLRKTKLNKAVLFIQGALTTAAMGIDHPELKALGCGAVVVGQVGPLLLQSAGEFHTEVTFIQWRPRVVAAATPQQKTPDKGQPKPQALDAQDLQIQTNQARIDQLNAQAAANIPGRGP